MTYPSDERYLKIAEVAKHLNVSRTTIWRWVQKGHFPKPVVLGPEQDTTSAKRWLASEVQEWLVNRRSLTNTSDIPVKE